MMKKLTSFSILLLLLSLFEVALLSSSNTITTHRCPTKCTLVGIKRNSFHRLEQDCPSTEDVVKCSTSLWLVSDGTLTISFEGDSSAQAINESLTPSLFNKFFYHHTQVTFYANVSETKVNVRNACFDQDDCSRIFARKIADQLLGYQYIQLEERIKPIIYDPLANTEIQFFTPNLQCAVDNNSSEIPCNTTCYISSSSIQQQRLCWPSTLVSLHVYTENALPAPINTTIMFDYNCNTRELACNGLDVSLNVTEIVNEFFYNPPYIPSPNSCIRCNTSHFYFIMIFASIFYIIFCFMQ